MSPATADVTPEAVAERLQQRLRQVVAGHSLTGRDGEQQYEAAAQRRGRRR